MAKDRKRSGRPTKGRDARTERRVLGEFKKNQWATYGQVAETIGGISTRTVNMVALENGYRRYLPACKPFISKANINKRYDYALDAQGWRWDNVIWTDETQIVLADSLSALICANLWFQPVRLVLLGMPIMNHRWSQMRHRCIGGCAN